MEALQELLNMILTWQFLLVAASCGALGLIIKAIPGIPTWIVPFVNTVFSVVFMMLLLGFTGEAALLGFLAAAFAAIIYDALKGLIENAIKPAVTKGEE